MNINRGVQELIAADLGGAGGCEQEQAEGAEDGFHGGNGFMDFLGEFGI